MELLLCGDAIDVDQQQLYISAQTVDLKDPRLVAMAGKVVAVIRVYPKELTENFEPLVNKVRNVIKDKVYELMKWETTDIAFGYKALDIYFLMPEDIDRGTEELEELIKSIEDIDNIDVIYITRIGV